ncbi:hypothetical protein BRADI_1g05195v3 [Brachypodium distachyon]|uniref:Neprosin PEP catalytic domain-containing protein n=1 Tax=Brachypodium distachyon TaxID=15368 RepID=A0A2K2DI77_BRADI|nr:hypothetical protein BRADI_1g05195v3 [Brachypodium distachyon]
MSKLNLGLYIIAIYVIFIVHQTQGGQLNSTNKRPDPSIDVNAIWVGRRVWPRHYGDSRTHFFTAWTLASGSKIVPGAPIMPVSDVNGKRQKITIKVFKEKTTRNWWIHYGFNNAPRAVGYYPAKLFDRLGKATDIVIGSVVGKSGNTPSLPMGSGFLPSNKAATITDISFINEDGRITGFDVPLRKFETKSSCYSITSVEGAKCSYGRPGGCK